eukprot:3532944-Amphidinium_carterae.1
MAAWKVDWRFGIQSCSVAIFSCASMASWWDVSMQKRVMWRAAVQAATGLCTLVDVPLSIGFQQSSSFRVASILSWADSLDGYASSYPGTSTSPTLSPATPCGWCVPTV